MNVNHAPANRNAPTPISTAPRQLAQVEAEQVNAVEHHALPGLQDADDRVDQRRLGRRWVGVEHRKPENAILLVDRVLHLAGGGGDSVSPCSAALSIFSPARSAGPFCSQAAAPSAVAATSTDRPIRIDRIGVLPYGKTRPVTG
jgi:hypothetical protein